MISNIQQKVDQKEYGERFDKIFNTHLEPCPFGCGELFKANPRLYSKRTCPKCKKTWYRGEYFMENVTKSNKDDLTKQ